MYIARVFSETLWSREDWILWMSPPVKPVVGAGNRVSVGSWGIGRRESCWAIPTGGLMNRLRKALWVKVCSLV